MHSQRGFSLLEVLVAFAILSISLGVLMQSFATGLRNTALAEEYSLAALHAESVLARLGTEAVLEPGTTGGEINDRFGWRATVTEFVDETLTEQDDFDSGIELPTVTYRVVVDVYWGSGPDSDIGAQRSISLETLRIVPNNDL